MLSPVKVDRYLLFILIFYLTTKVALSTQLTNNCGDKNNGRAEILDSRYKVEWTVDDESKSIELLVTVNTSGWVGFGLSYNGDMTGADIVIGGVTVDGATYFQDYHGIGNTKPVLDGEQNCELLDASEIDNVTYLQFKRLLDTCDEQDILIDDGTLKLIWAIGDTDTIKYHGSNNRGAFSTNLLDPPLPPVTLTNVSYELTTRIKLDGRVTTYWCSIHKRESLKKTQITAFNPKLESAEALKYVHHFLLFACKAPEGQNADELFGPVSGNAAEDCWDPQSSTSNAEMGRFCSANLYAWAVGGRMLVFPDDIGFAWGEEPSEYFYFQVHINNPEGLSGIGIETGVFIYDTDIMRPKEAGLLAVEYFNTVSLFVPPAAYNFTIAGHGSSFRTKEAVPATGINIFNLNLHAHVSAKAIAFRHFRNGTELPWIGRNDHYDFNYQESRPLRKYVTVLPNDHVIVECTYDSTWKKVPYPVIGGYATTDEMCMAFAFYYPRIKNADRWCSVYPQDKLLARYGITKTTKPDPYAMDMDPIVISPYKWKGRKVTRVLNSTVAWTEKEKARLGHEIRYGVQDDYCVGIDSMPLQKNSGSCKPIMRHVKYPKIDKPYSIVRNCPARKK